MSDEKQLIRSEFGAVSDANGAGTDLPALVAGGGDAARFAYEEFLHGRVRNPHTRRAYERASRRFFDSFGDSRTLTSITPADVGRYLDGLELSDTSKKLHLAAIRHLFDELVTRHVVVLNPAASVRGPRLSVVEGADAGDHGAPGPHAAGQRPHRIGGRAAGPGGGSDADLHGRSHRGGGPAAAAGLLPRRRAVAPALHRQGREEPRNPLPARPGPDAAEYAGASEVGEADDARLFRTADGRTGRLTGNPAAAGDLARMVKRRMRDAGLPKRLSPHSFRVATITDLLEQGVPLDDVQRLAGHADPRTTRLYDRRDRKVSRNIVERISV